MPNCFSLRSKKTGEVVSLQEVDNLMWRSFTEEEPSNTNWLCGWYSVIGLYLSFGKSFDEIQGLLEAEDLKEINLFLKEYYTVESWYQPK